jgi:hypothetical protein
MSLPILVAIVAVGIALTVAAVHFTGGSRMALIDGAENARRLFAADYPDEQTSETAITIDRHSAFLPLPGGRMGIVQSFGDGFFTRIATARDVAQLKVRAPATVSIRFRDFTWTGGHFSFAASRDAERIAAVLAPGPQQGLQEVET